MTETTETVERTEEQVAQEQQDAEAGFAAGFAKVHGDTPPTAKPDTPEAAETPEADKEAEAKAQADADAKATADRVAADKAAYDALPQVVRDKLEKIDGITGAVEKLAGHVGGFKRDLNAAIATAKAAATSKGVEAPTDKQVQAALSDPEAWKQLREDFPSWAEPVERELTAIRAEIAKKAAPTIDVAAIESRVVKSLQPMVAEAENKGRALAYLDIKHPTWEQDINTPDFKSWMTVQPNDVRALADSTNRVDAVRMLDLYADHRKQAFAAAERLKKQTRRLEGAVTPQGTVTTPTTAVSDKQAFNRGFSDVAGNRL